MRRDLLRARKARKDVLSDKSQQKAIDIYDSTSTNTRGGGGDGSHVSLSRRLRGVSGVKCVH